MPDREVLRLSDINRVTRGLPGTSRPPQPPPPGPPLPPKTVYHNPVWEGHVHGPMGSGFDWPRGCIFIRYISTMPTGGGSREHYFRYAIQGDDPTKTLRQPSDLVDPDLDAWLSNLREPTYLRIEYRRPNEKGQRKFKHWFDVTPCEEAHAKNAARKQRNQFDNDQAEARQERRVK